MPIEVNQVSYYFEAGAPAVLSEVSLSISRRETIGVVGPNECGKTTLARILNGRLLPESGTVLVDGLDSANPSTRNQIKQRVVLIESDPTNQLITNSVFDEVAFAMQALGWPAEKIKTLTWRILEEYDLSKYAMKHPYCLSQGEQFRLLLATALARNPHYLILDELTSMIDSITRYHVLDMLYDASKQHHIGIVIITHRLGDLVDADRLYIMNKGQLVTEGKPDEIFREAFHHPEWNILGSHKLAIDNLK